VLGSAGMAAFMTSRISAEIPFPTQTAEGEGSVTRLPAFLHEPFAAAMSQSLLLPAFVALFGVVAAMFLLGFGDAELLVDDPDEMDLDEDMEDADRNAGYAVEYGGDETFVDDDEYLEYTVSWDEPDPPELVVLADDSVTAPMRSRPDHLLHAPADAWRGDPVDSWHSLLSDLPAKPKSEPIGFAHNGFHVDEEQRFQPLPAQAPEQARPSRHARSARHYLPEGEPERRSFWFESNSRHARNEPDDATSYGRHSMPGRD